MDKLEYLYNVTGVRYELSSQSLGKSKYYAIFSNGKYVMTNSHVSGHALYSCMDAYIKGYIHCAADFAPKGL